LAEDKDGHGGWDLRGRDQVLDCDVSLDDRWGWS
jgi:hypothetical protein